ncbi:hypothetical protein [Porcipelethomonas sp.]|uniref:hypothetical protein n=1 Tax=Porcipelethomonas sp. TaxID=2981675 RepID=UPI003077EEF5
MKKLENNIENLINAEPAYNESESENDSGFVKKMSRKKGGNALGEFGARQNELNFQLIQTVSDLKEYCRELEERLEKETDARHKTAAVLSAMKKELDSVRLRSTLNSNQIEKMDGGLGKYTEKLENYALSISPGARLADCPKGCKEADISNCIGYYEKIETARNSVGLSENTELEKFLYNALSREFSAMSAFDKVVIDFYGEDRYAAVLYGNLSRNSIYKINRMEDNCEPQGNFSIICTENLQIPKKLALKSAVIIVTGNEPFENISDEELENLKFLNDCGLHTYITLSDSTYRSFVQKGFRCVSLISADKLMSGKIVRTIEKSMETSVPSGAVTFSQLNHVLEASGKKFTDVSGETAGSEALLRSREYPYNCLSIMEKTAVNAAENYYFSGENINRCRISDTHEGIFDVINGLNYVNHLDYSHRKKIYARVKTMMETDGLFIFNGFDAVIGIKLRAINGWGEYPVYEALWTREQLISELEDNGFKIKFLIPAGTGIFDMLPPKYRKSPAEWIIGVTV